MTRRQWQPAHRRHGHAPDDRALAARRARAGLSSPRWSATSRTSACGPPGRWVATSPSPTPTPTRPRSCSRRARRVHLARAGARRVARHRRRSCSGRTRRRSSPARSSRRSRSRPRPARGDGAPALRGPRAPGGDGQRLGPRRRGTDRGRPVLAAGSVGIVPVAPGRRRGGAGRSAGHGDRRGRASARWAMRARGCAPRRSRDSNGADDYKHALVVELAGRAVREAAAKAARTRTRCDTGRPHDGPTIRRRPARVRRRPRAARARDDRLHPRSSRAAARGARLLAEHLQETCCGLWACEVEPGWPGWRPASGRR